jgi:hypothetical protein
MFNDKNPVTLGTVELVGILRVTLAVVHALGMRVVSVHGELLLGVEAGVAGVARVDEVRVAAVQQFGGQLLGPLSLARASRPKEGLNISVGDPDPDLSLAERGSETEGRPFDMIICTVPIQFCDFISENGQSRC